MSAAVRSSLRIAQPACPAVASLQSTRTPVIKAPSARPFTTALPASRAPTMTTPTVASNSTTVAAAAAGTALQPFTIIGGGRVGLALRDMGPGGDVILGRGDAIDGPPGPILVCTRNDVLGDIIDATPPERRRDLVFVQNGMLQPFLDARGLGDATQLLVYFAVAKLGDPPSDGKTDLNPEGLTAVTGPHAEAVAARLHAGNLSCAVLSPEDFKKSMLEKLIWICAFMLVGASHGGITVGEVESQYRDEVDNLIGELGAAGSAALGVTLEDRLEERLRAYARSVAHFPTAVKEFPWRNGWFYGLSEAAASEGQADPCPTHTALLKEVGAI